MMPPIPSVSDCRAIGIPMPDLLVRMEDALGVELVRAFLTDRAGRQYSVRRTETTAGRPHNARMDPTTWIPTCPCWYARWSNTSRLPCTSRGTRSRRG